MAWMILKKVAIALRTGVLFTQIHYPMDSEKRHNRKRKHNPQTSLCLDPSPPNVNSLLFAEKHQCLSLLLFCGFSSAPGQKYNMYVCIKEKRKKC